MKAFHFTSGKNCPRSRGLDLSDGLNLPVVAWKMSNSLNILIYILQYKYIVWEETEQSPHHSLLSWILPSCGITSKQQINLSPVLTLVPPVAFGELLNTQHVQVSLLYIYIHISMYTYILKKSYLFNLLQCSRKQQIMLKHLKARSSIKDRDQEPRKNEQWFHISPQSSGVNNHPQPLKIRILPRELKDRWKITRELWGGGKKKVWSENTTANPKHLWANHWFAIPNHFSAWILRLLSYLIFSQGIPRISLLWKDLSSSTLSTS